MGGFMKLIQLSVVILVLIDLQGTHGQNTGSGGGEYEGNEYTQSAKCPDASCQSPPRGIWCDANYNVKEDDGCCPEWKCRNGQTVYGIRRKTNNWNSWKSKWNTEWSSKFPSGSVGQWGNWVNSDKEEFVSNLDPLFDRYDGKRR